MTVINRSKITISLRGEGELFIEFNLEFSNLVSYILLQAEKLEFDGNHLFVILVVVRLKLFFFVYIS